MVSNDQEDAAAANPAAVGAETVAETSEGISTEAAESQTTIDGLAMDSYTANQLKHSTPEHMHITSRRCFIGPIPEDWLSKHRKSWYRYRPSFARYSSRTADFLASANVAKVRNVSGLEGMTGAFRQSFPQPEDVDEHPDGHDEIGGEGFNQGEEGEHNEIPVVPDNLTELRPASTMTAVKSADMQSPPELLPTGSLKQGIEPARSASTSHKASRSTRSVPAQSSLWWKRANTRESRPSFLRKMSGKSAGSASFVTAAESLDEEQSDEEDEVIDDQQADEQLAKDKVVQRQLTPVRSGPLTPETTRNSASDRSTAGLLEHAGGAGVGSERRASDAPPSTGATDLSTRPRTPKTPKTPKSVLKPPGSSHVRGTAPTGTTKDNDDGGIEALKPLAPTTTNLVRFNEPETKPSRPPEDVGSQNDLQKRSLKTHLRRRSSLRAGQLVKADRMLVRVDSTAHSLGPDYDENSYFTVEARTISKWREYVVCCRQADDEDADFVLRMYKSRVVPLVENQHTSNKFLHEIVLRKRDVHVNFFSTLDKTIVIWAPWKHVTRIYILQLQSSSDATQWYHFLRTCLGWRRPPELNVRIPDLDITLTIDNPFAQRDETANKSKLGSEFTSETEGDGGVAKNIIIRCLDLLSKSSLSDTTEIWKQHGDRLGLAWRRYDRLEWISGVSEENMYGSMAMQVSHELELLPKQHYPTNSAKPDPFEEGLEEPPPVEGFLVRMTSQKGRHKRAGKDFYKKLYFYTSNELLCFCQPSKALPPKPPVLASQSGGDAPSAKQVAEQIPLIFGVNPYPLQDGKILWLDSDEENKSEKDRIAYEEAERRTNMLLASEAYINLTHIVKVRRIREEVPAPDSVPDDEQTILEDSGSDGERTDFEDDTDAQKRSFELIMRNGLSVRLQAYSVEARKEWVRRLRRLIRYWRARKSSDARLMKGIRRENLERLQVDEEMEAIIGQFARKWEVRRSVASRDIWNMCSIACCRSISLYGVLYRKPRLHSNFKRCSVVLAHGKLLVFQNTLRKANGEAIPHVHHERQEVIELDNTYVYSGLITDDDLLHQKQTFSAEHPGIYTTPRIYLDNSWTSSDEDTMTCFCLWQSRRRSLFRGVQAADDGSIRSRLRYVNSLGVPGHTMVFMTRSRAERDRWVLSIGLEIERLKRGGASRESDIRITGDKPKVTET